jgi:hypothetical protein
VVVTAVQPELTVAGDWIMSDVDTTILEIFKTPDAAKWTAGSAVGFRADGGEAIVSGAIVTARLPWANSVTVGRRYFVFAGFNKNTGAVVAGPGGM